MEWSYSPDILGRIDCLLFVIVKTSNVWLFHVAAACPSMKWNGVKINHGNCSGDGKNGLYVTALSMYHVITCNTDWALCPMYCSKLFTCRILCNLYVFLLWVLSFTFSRWGNWERASALHLFEDTSRWTEKPGRFCSPWT